MNKLIVGHTYIGFDGTHRRITKIWPTAGVDYEVIGSSEVTTATTGNLPPDHFSQLFAIEDVTDAINAIAWKTTTS